MTVTLHWWMFPIALFVTGLGIAIYGNSKPRGSYDFFTGLPELAVCLACWTAAIGVLIGHFVA